MGKLIAQFECELAEQTRAAGEVDDARAAVARAYAADANSVRAGMIEGRIELDAGNDAAAIRAFERVARARPRLPAGNTAGSCSAATNGPATAPGARAFLPR